MRRPASALPDSTCSSIRSKGTTTWRAAGWYSRSARNAVVSSPGTATVSPASAARGSAGRGARGRGKGAGSRGLAARGPERLRVKGIDRVLVLGVLGAAAGPLGGLVAQEAGVGAARTGGVTRELVGSRPQHEAVEVRRHRPEDRVGLSQRPRPVAPRQVQDADVVARIEIERRQLGVGAEGHRQEEADAVLDAALGEADDAVEQAPRLLLGGHL